MLPASKEGMGGRSAGRARPRAGNVSMQRLIEMPVGFILRAAGEGKTYKRPRAKIGEASECGGEPRLPIAIAVSCSMLSTRRTGVGARSEDIFVPSFTGTGKHDDGTLTLVKTKPLAVVNASSDTSF